MDIRMNLINDIEQFHVKAIELYNRAKIVKKSTYFNLVERISALTINNFDSEENFKYFLEFNNHLECRAIREKLVYLFQGDFLEQGPFLWMCKYLTGVANWLK